MERGRKVAREHCVRHGCACAPGEFWPEAVAAIDSEFDLSALERVHLGTDGEGWCKRGGAYFPLRVEVTGHLDPFHVDQAAGILSCSDIELPRKVRIRPRRKAAVLLGATGSTGRDAPSTTFRPCPSRIGPASSRAIRSWGSRGTAKTS